MECVLMGENNAFSYIHFDVRKCHSPHFMMTLGPALSRAFFWLHFVFTLLAFPYHGSLRCASCIWNRVWKVEKAMYTKNISNTIFCGNFFIALPASEGAILLKC